ncbi:MAG: glycosyltransferase family 4 protein [Candidatus Omnitrophica bacterium]|nr:glycosyltransferase family 4 protein [Candidatus Omnitrophota bacterium]
MRVLFVSAEAGVKAGGELFLMDVIKGLAPDMDMACVCPAEGELAAALRRQGVLVFISPTNWSRKLRDWPGQCWRLACLGRALHLFEPQVIFANGGYTNNLAVRLARRLGCRVAAYIQDVFDPPQGDKYAFGQADAAAACSVGIADLVRPFNPRVNVIYHGIDTAQFSPDGRLPARAALGLSEEQFIVGFTGTIIRKKGIYEFINAARLIAAQVPQARFLIAGSPKAGEEEILQQLNARLAGDGLQDRVRWLGFVGRIEDVMPAFDVFLFPTHFEALGRVIIEAMACGVVPVSSLAIGPREIIEDGRTGYLRPHDDIAALAAAVISLHRDAALRVRMAAAARKVVQEKFSTQAMLNGVKALIERAAPAKANT